MLPILMAIGCLTGIQKNCPNPTPIMNYQLKNIWNPTNPYLSKNYESGTWVTNRSSIDKRALWGKTLRVALVNEPPWVTGNYSNNTFTGVGRVVLGVLREALGFDWELVYPEDNCVGMWDEAKKQYTGVVKLLHEKKADFALTYMSMLPERTDILDFSRPFGEERWVIMMSRPQETTDGDGLVAPFQTEVWYYLMISLVLMGPVCFLMIGFRCWLCKGHPTFAQFYSIGNCVWFVYGALMKQGSVLKPSSDSTRILFATWWIFVTILTAFYTANLTAYLTLSKIPIPFDRLEKVGYRDYWIVRRGDTLEAVVKTTNATVGDQFTKQTQRWGEFSKLRYKVDAYGSFLDNYTEIIEKVRREKYLLLDEQSRVERIVYRDFRSQSKKNTVLHKRCAFIMSRQPALRIPYGFAFQRNSTIKPIFDPVLDKLTKAGLFNYWRREDLPVKDPCSADSDFRERQLRNGDLLTTYILCGSGYLMSFISFIFECIIRWFYQRKMQGQLVPADKQIVAGGGFYKGNLAVPAGAPTFFDTDKFLKNINGRDYVVMKTPDGRTRLVPKNDGMQALQPVYNPPPPISYNYMT